MLETFINVIWLELQIRSWSKKPINEADDGNWFFLKRLNYEEKERKKENSMTDCVN